VASTVQDSQLLLSEQQCLECVVSGTLWATMRLSLLVEIYQHYTRDTMPDANQLAADSACYECYGPNDYTLRLMELALLRRILLILDPTAPVEPQQLLDESTCFNCYGSNSIEQLLELVLLSKINDVYQAPQ